MQSLQARSISSSWVRTEYAGLEAAENISANRSARQEHDRSSSVIAFYMQEIPPTPDEPSALGTYPNARRVTGDYAVMSLTLLVPAGGIYSHRSKGHRENNTASATLPDDRRFSYSLPLRWPPLLVNLPRRNSWARLAPIRSAVPIANSPKTSPAPRLDLG